MEIKLFIDTFVNVALMAVVGYIILQVIPTFLSSSGYEFFIGVGLVLLCVSFIYVKLSNIKEKKNEF